MPISIGLVSSGGEGCGWFLALLLAMHRLPILRSPLCLREMCLQAFLRGLSALLQGALCYLWLVCCQIPLKQCLVSPACNLSTLKVKWSETASLQLPKSVTVLNSPCSLL